VPVAPISALPNIDEPCVKITSGFSVASSAAFPPYRVAQNLRQAHEEGGYTFRKHHW